MATGFPTKANWVSGDILTAAQMDDLAGTVNLFSNASAASGTVLVSNVAGTSFAYQPLQAAGKNAVINGGMDIWQRGTSFVDNNQYTADRWYVFTSGFVGKTFSRISSGLTGFNYAIRVQRNNAVSNTNGVELTQSLETVNSIPFAGQTVTLSFYTRAGSGLTGGGFGANLVSGTGTDQNVANGGFTGATSFSVTGGTSTSWTKYSVTAAIPSNSTQLGIRFLWYPTGTAGANDYFDITGVQLELGSVATTFSRAGGSIGGELALCQRYYYRATVATNGGAIAIGEGTSTTQGRVVIPFPVAMRVAPSFTSAGSTFWAVYQQGAGKGASTVTLITADVQQAYLAASGTSITAGGAAVLGTTLANAYFEFASEL